MDFLKQQWLLGIFYTPAFPTLFFRSIIKLTDQQISNFAANSLEVENKDGAKQLIISTRGWATLTPEQQVYIL